MLFKIKMLRNIVKKIVLKKDIDLQVIERYRTKNVDERYRECGSQAFKIKKRLVLPGLTALDMATSTSNTYCDFAHPWAPILGHKNSIPQTQARRKGIFSVRSIYV